MLINSIILILSKKSSEYMRLLSKSICIDYITIIDDHINDDLILSNNFISLTKTIKSPCSWEKAFYIIKQQELYNFYDSFYFIEDDVFSNDLSIFNRLINYLNNKNSDFIAHSLYESSGAWIFWPKIKDDIKYFTYQYLTRSFNPFCRLSSRLIKSVLKFQQEHQTFIFHEILFPSISKQNNYSIEYLNKDKEYNNYFSTFTYHRNFLNKNNIKDNKIYHSIKPIYDNRAIA